MGCGGSRSSRTLPVTRLSSQIGTVDNNDWVVYAPVCHNCFHCGRRYVEACDSSQRFANNEDRPLSCFLSTPPPFSSSSYSASNLNSNSVPTPIGPWVGNGSRNTSPRRGSSAYSSLDYVSGTSRSYSLLSTPTFHKPSSHPRNGLTLDPTLFAEAISPSTNDVQCTQIDTACASRFSGTSSPPSFDSPTSSSGCSDQRYPLPPLSVRTEPFPR